MQNLVLVEKELEELDKITDNITKFSGKVINQINKDLKTTVNEENKKQLRNVQVKIFTTLSLFEFDSSISSIKSIIRSLNTVNMRKLYRLKSNDEYIKEELEYFNDYLFALAEILNSKVFILEEILKELNTMPYDNLESYISINNYIQANISADIQSLHSYELLLECSGLFKRYIELETALSLRHEIFKI